ncbi:PhzF family phenazine biosynthesis protein [Marinobacter sp. LV10MA510-1]|uniref:PhzF family phenazine biosynthesis protein n=1 Tax=Marinobacter sp. LV10MA510-1 TaxID=1415567 RepID=UPI000C001B36|nr:PhzF family phenazine biosynthesis protein [Marinobacter sp. LV10MA510-1]PFG09404.1 trans-2,3-dihydro-3-hydroxyanthranilate isomerase [Marinobacter sp. LV10MA510-1]
MEGYEYYPIRIFTPNMELPFAGHPTVGTAHLLAELGMALRDRPLTLDAGPLVVAYDKNLTRFTVAAPIHIQTSTLEKVTAAQLLGLEPEEVASKPVLASCGLPYHLIELESLKALGRVQLSPSIWSENISPSGCDQIYLYVAENASSTESVLRARMFCGEGGQREDPATGSAAAALVGMLSIDEKIPGLRRWKISQGVEMNRPSLIFAETEYDNNSLVIRIAGQVVIVGTGIIGSAKKSR